MQSFQGLSDDDNAATIGGRIVPPDVNGDIGLDQLGNKVYLQYINLIWALYSETGTLLAGPIAGNSFWQGFGGFCQSNNDGDPVALYDDHAGRWMVSQFSINQGIQCVAVSTTSDPVGLLSPLCFRGDPGWFRTTTQRSVSGTTAPAGSAGQSAYTFTTLRDFGVRRRIILGLGSGVMERDAMLSGAAAQFTKFSEPLRQGRVHRGAAAAASGGPAPTGRHLSDVLVGGRFSLRRLAAFHRWLPQPPALRRLGDDRQLDLQRRPIPARGVELRPLSR